MLSEKRRKVKYSTDPNGNLWANNSNGFGRQMLERMGWSPGEGLGKSGTGIRAPIKASTQKGTRGLGMKSDYTLGSKQMDEYANLLKALNAACPASSSSSDVKKSRSSSNLKSTGDKLRSHPYQKIIRAKDATQYDRQALSVILGGTAEQPGNSPKLFVPDKAETQDPVSVPFLKTVNSALSIEEYFDKCRQKMKFNKSSESNPMRNDEMDNQLFSIAGCTKVNPIASGKFSNDSVFYGTNLLTIPGYSCY